tara:strand:- start:70 stop:1179 length:1110 start_codon:yes stop_codon:yes gene_type:complete
MPTSADVLNFAVKKLTPQWQEQFYQYHPVLDKIILNGNIDKAHTGAPFLEFPVVTNGPGQVTRIETGSEVYSSVRRTVGARGQVYCPRMIYSFVIPGKDLAEASGETAIARLLKVYPEAAIMEFHEHIVSQFVNGNGSDNNVQGFVTLNGNSTFNPAGTDLTGVMQYDPIASQDDTVFNLAKSGAASGVTGWHNQYVKSTSSTLRASLREAYWKASVEGKQGGPVDMMLCDMVTFNKYYDDLDDQVRYASSFKGETGKRGASRQGLMFQEAEFYTEPALDTSLAAFGADAAGPRLADSSAAGVTYLLKTDTWHMYTLGEDSGMETKGDFAIRGPVKVPGQDAWEWEIVLSMQLYCDRLNANGVVTSTAL